MSSTELLYMNDCYQRQFAAQVIKQGENFVVLDQTAFYPQGGGQPSDQGKLKFDGEEVKVTGVKKHKGEVRHIIKGEVPQEGAEVEGELDWERRHTLMRMHTAQHLVSAIVFDNYEATVSGNQIHLEESRIDFNPVRFSDEDLEQIESDANELIAEELPVKIYQMKRARLREKVDQGRANLDLIPDSIDPLRVVEIEGIDICPCGGTHVQNLKELGQLKITGRETKGKQTDRVSLTVEDR